MKKYLVLTRLGSSTGGEVWLPGSAIELDDVRAQILLRAGAIEAINDTVPPAEPAPAVIVHEAPADQPKKEKGK